MKLASFLSQFHKVTRVTPHSSAISSCVFLSFLSTKSLSTNRSAAFCCPGRNLVSSNRNRLLIAIYIFAPFFNYVLRVFCIFSVFYFIFIYFFFIFYIIYYLIFIYIFY